MPDLRGEEVPPAVARCVAAPEEGEEEQGNPQDAEL